MATSKVKRTSPLFVDKKKIQEIVARTNAEMGFVPDPAATPAKARQMMLNRGIRPEDNLFSRGIIAARDEDYRGPLALDLPTIDRLMRMSDELGIRIEMAGGIPTWEPRPNINHQAARKRIMAAIRNCVWYPDVEVIFPDGSFKRPDIAIWRREPDETDEAVTLIPEAVIEIISKGFEKKDTEIGAPFYLSMGVKDVILFNPYTSCVEHRRADGTQEMQSPARIELACGCECTF